MNKWIMRRFACPLLYLLSIHVLALLFFFVFRLVLFLSTDYVFPEAVAHQVSLQAMAFLKGLWFDNVIACYILLLPLVLTWMVGCCNYTAKWVYRTMATYFVGFYAVAFAISVANIPYFAYFFKVINSSIYSWFDYTATTAGMMFGESSYYFPIFLGCVSIGLFAWAAFRLAQYFYRCSQPENTRSVGLSLRLCTGIWGAVCIGLCLFGIRGRMGYNPIKVSQAYYCEDPFLNQLGVNPVFNLLTSTLDDCRKENRQLSLMPEQEAISHVQKWLHRRGIAGISPIAREVKQDTAFVPRNVVLIFMESMSAHLMNSFGSSKGLTPYLDSLFHESLSFNRFYSAGIHTNHGMYATLYSFPAIMKRNAMKGSVIPVYSGLPTVLKEHGYRNLFFMTHESQYDNMNAFFRTNGFDEIYAQEDYPADKVVNSFGVQDDFLYQYALPILNERAQSDTPFFAVLLSISNHPPYVVPDYFTPRSQQPEEQIVEYADWSIRQFMTEARKQPWFDNTLFVLLGDHGKLVGTPDCEMPQSYNHIPLMIYGKGIAPKLNEALGGQVDVAPTLLGLLGIDYTQNNFGVDLLKEQRPCMFYAADNLIAARDSSRLYIYAPESGQAFNYRWKGTRLQRSTEGEAAYQHLKDYVFSMLQSAEYLVRNRQTIDKPMATKE